MRETLCESLDESYSNYISKFHYFRDTVINFRVVVSNFMGRIIYITSKRVVAQ